MSDLQDTDRSVQKAVLGAAATSMTGAAAGKPVASSSVVAAGPSGAAVFASAPAPVGGNLQTFTAGLGGALAPAVTAGGRGAHQLLVVSRLAITGY